MGLPLDNPSGRPPTRLTFGIYTHTTPANMFTRFASIVSYLETNLTAFGVRIDLVIYKGYSNLVSALTNGSVHLGRPGPASYVVARHSDPSLIPVLKQVHTGRAIIDGVIFTRPDTGIENLADLKGKSFAFGDPDSNFGNYVPKAELFRAELRAKDLQWVHFHNHEEVVRAVMDGQFQAGAANLNVVAKLGGGKLKIIHKMQSVSFPWVATTNLPPHLLKPVTDSLLSLKDPAILTKIDRDLTGFMPAQPEDYDELEQEMQLEAKFEGR